MAASWKVTVWLNDEMFFVAKNIYVTLGLTQKG
jgi:hypothetical protein